MVLIDMSQYDCPYERNCMMNDKRELIQTLPQK